MSQDQPSLPPKPAPAAPPDAGHVPMTEEFDRARWTLPPATTVLLAAVIVAAVVAVFVWRQSPKPGASGLITRVAAVEPNDPARTLVVVHVRIQNLHERPFWVKGTKVAVKTDQGEFEDTAASFTDIDRYLQAFPELQPYRIAPLKPESRIESGDQAEGMVVVSFEIPKAHFDARKELAVIIDAYDRQPLVLKEAR